MGAGDGYTECRGSNASRGGYLYDCRNRDGDIVCERYQPMVRDGCGAATLCEHTDLAVHRGNAWKRVAGPGAHLCPHLPIRHNAGGGRNGEVHFCRGETRVTFEPAGEKISPLKDVRIPHLPIPPPALLESPAPEV